MDKKSSWRAHGATQCMLSYGMPARHSAYPAPMPCAGLPSLAAGRLVTVLALLAFLGSYLCGIFFYGWKIGMAFGWLPAGTLAWLTAQALACVIRLMYRNDRDLPSRCKSVFMPALAPCCCRGGVKKKLQYRRQGKCMPACLRRN